MAAKLVRTTPTPTTRTWNHLDRHTAKPKQAGKPLLKQDITDKTRTQFDGIMGFPQNYEADYEDNYKEDYFVYGSITASASVMLQANM